MNNLKLGQRVIAVLAVAVGLLSSSAPSAVLRLEVTYTNGGVDFGPICPAMPALPSEVCATFTFVGNRFSDNIVPADNAVVTALVQFGDAVWTEADVEFFAVNYAQGGVLGLNYQFFPIDTATVLGIVVRNFPLTIEGTCIADGQDFQYTYTNSSSVLTDTCPEDVNDDGVVNVLDLIDLLLCFGAFPTSPPCNTGQDINQDGAPINVLDLIELLLAFGTACP